jgi:uncharacterized protein YqjF (DUF2071 family)
MLFLHWRMDPGDLRRHVPDHLEIDTWDGDAWVSLVLFRLRVRPRFLPFLPWISNLAEANLRTYVRCRGQSGIFFLSVHADNRLAMWIARLMTPMPYEHATMRYERLQYRYQVNTQATKSNMQAEVTIHPTGADTYTEERSLDEWLLERYRLFICDSRGRPMSAEVTHPRWVVRHAEVSGSAAAFGRALGLKLSLVPDLAHFSEGVKARFGRFHRLESTEQIPTSSLLTPVK